LDLNILSTGRARRWLKAKQDIWW